MANFADCTCVYLFARHISRLAPALHGGHAVQGFTYTFHFGGRMFPLILKMGVICEIWESFFYKVGPSERSEPRSGL